MYIQYLELFSYIISVFNTWNYSGILQVFLVLGTIQVSYKFFNTWNYLRIVNSQTSIFENTSVVESVDMGLLKCLTMRKSRTWNFV